MACDRARRAAALSRSISLHHPLVTLPHAPASLGFVANFASEVVKEPLPLSAGGLGCQGVEQFGRSEALVALFDYHLPFLDHVHEFDADESGLRGVKRFEPEHRMRDPFDSSMVLLNGLITNDKFCMIRQSQIKLY